MYCSIRRTPESSSSNSLGNLYLATFDAGNALFGEDAEDVMVVPTIR
jgi:hypothetical protein